MLAIAGLEDRILIWDVVTRRVRATLRHPEGSGAMAFGSTPIAARATLATGGFGDVRLWEASSGRLLAHLQAHPLMSNSVLTALAISPDGRFLAAGTEDVRIWSLEGVGGAPRRRRILQHGPSTICGIAFSPDSRQLAEAVPGSVKLWDPVTGKLQASLTGHDMAVQTLAYSRNGSLLASSAFGEVRLWGAKNGRPVRRLGGHHSWVDYLAFTSDGRTLASGSQNDGSVRLWNPATGELRKVLQEHVLLTDLACSPDSRWLASAGYQLPDGPNKVWLWDAERARLRMVLPVQPGSEIERIAFSPDSRLLATGSYEGSEVELWELPLPLASSWQQGEMGGYAPASAPTM